MHVQVFLSFPDKFDFNCLFDGVKEALLMIEWAGVWAAPAPPWPDHYYADVGSE